MSKTRSIVVKETEIAILKVNDSDYISLTDMVRNFEDGFTLIEKWLRNKNTIEFLGIWEQIYNADFNSPEFEVIKNEAGLNRFTLSVKKWIEKTNAVGIFAKAGRYGSGTYAHKDIAFEFGSWLSPEFKLYLIKEFQRLKDEENDLKKLEWNLNRTLAKINYRIHTDSIKENLIPRDLSKFKEQLIYAGEADLLNIALFGKTAKQWREENPEKAGNIRDYSTLEQLLVLANLESMNAEMIRDGIEPNKRIMKLNQTAIKQMKTLIRYNTIKRIK